MALKKISMMVVALGGMGVSTAASADVDKRRERRRATESGVAEQAAMVIETIRPAHVEELLRARDFPIERRQGSDGIPYTRFKAAGVNHVVYYYDCDEQQRCESIQLYSGYVPADKSGMLEKVNEWNRTHRLSRAYVDRAGDPCIETDLHLQQGVTLGAVDAYISDFLLSVFMFNRFLL